MRGLDLIISYLLAGACKIRFLVLPVAFGHSRSVCCMSGKSKLSVDFQIFVDVSWYLEINFKLFSPQALA